jgi:dTDP-glucose pyrophosphorylase
VIRPGQALPLVKATDDVLTAMSAIQNAQQKLALVVDDFGKLVGTVTDGDVRRGLLAGLTVASPVAETMNLSPIALYEGEAPGAILPLMDERGILVVPVLDRKGRPIRLISREDLGNPQKADATVLLMAGGLGARLRPLTDTVPKPLLLVGGRPMLEITVENLKNQGFRRFYISVNYRADMIEAHFGDGSQLGVSISYLREKDRLGTAGALSLLPRPLKGPVVVMNGDILTTLDVRLLLAHHEATGAAATICVREHKWQVPYGVVRTDKEGRFAGVDEKPLRRELISSGIYAFSQSARELLVKGKTMDMPDLMELCRQRLSAPSVFLLKEYWLDIGHLDDLQRAQDDVIDLFN